MTDLISRTALLAVFRKERDDYHQRFFTADPEGNVPRKAALAHEEELEQLDQRIEMIEKFPNVEPIAKLVNNNQAGNFNLIETAPNVTIDIGTELYMMRA